MAAELNSPELIESFDELSLLPERKWNNNTHYTPSVLKSVNTLIGGTAIDAGCGTGDGARRMAKLYKKVIAYDVSPMMIEKAQSLSEGMDNIEYKNESFLDADIEESSCGCLLCVSMLHHMDMEEFFRKAKRVLKKGGRLLVVDLYRMETAGDALCSIIGSLIKRPIQILRGAAKVTPIEADTWRRHGALDEYHTLKEIKSLAEGMLGDVKLKRRLLFRYTMVWIKK